MDQDQVQDTETQPEQPEQTELKVTLQERPEEQLPERITGITGNQPYKGVDTTVKHLLHRTEADLIAPTQSEIADNFELLLAEARAKIRPVIQVMTDEELDSLVKDVQELKDDTSIVPTKQDYHELFVKHGITLEELRKIQDKHYEVDVEFELTRDLYHKQRIMDVYLEQHQEDNKLLNSFYKKIYHKAKHNKFLTLVYKLPYEPRHLRSNYRMMWFTTGIATGALYMINPWLTVLLAYEYFLLFSATKVLNRTCSTIILDQSKRHLLLGRLNFLGFMKEPTKHRIPLKQVMFVGEYENTSITMRTLGLLPSMQKYFARDEDESKTKDGADGGDFRYFYEFMAANERFYVAKDHPDHDKAVPSEELLMYVIKGNQRGVQYFDYSTSEAERTEELKKINDAEREILDFKNIGYDDKQRSIEREYMYLEPNREFSGKYEDQKLKAVDDGTFIDNGYR